MISSHRLHARCACSAAPFSLPHTERKYERSRPFATTHLALDLEIDFAGKAVEGTARLVFERRSPLDHELRLDAVGFELRSIEIRDTARDDEPSKADYEYDGDEILIRVPEELRAGEVLVTYRAKPRLGLYFLEPDDQVKDRPTQVWSQCQDEDARHWFPCQDKPHVKMTTEIRATVPHGMTVLSNGDLIDSHTPGGAKKPWTFHFQHSEPHPAYLVTLVAGRFDELTDLVRLPSGREIPLRYLVPPGAKKDGERAFGDTPRMIELFSRVIGVEYPWSRYSQVVVSDFIFGGMENTTATTMYEHILLDARATLDVTSNDLVAHELAHQWFGDLVTCRDWSHAWLNEGFATYFEHVEREHRLDRDEYEHGVAGDLDTYLGEARDSYQRPIVCRDYEEPIDLFDRHLYEKGGLVLHMLRKELGDEVFWTAVRDYLETNRGGIVETTDLVRALEKASGRSLERFFDQWVYRPGHPVLEVEASYDDGLLTVNLQQKQKGKDATVFHFPFEIEVSVGGTIERHRRAVTSRQEALVLRTNRRPDWVAFDPEFRVTAPVNFKAPADLLRRQLARGTTARLRRVAAEALGRRQDPTTITALRVALLDDNELWMVRAAAARSLGRIRGEDAFAALAEGSRIEHPKVRRAVAATLGRFRTPESGKLLDRLAKDESYLVAAAAARALGRAAPKKAFESLLSLLDTWSWSEVVRAGALHGLADLGDERGVEALIERTNYGHPLRARRAALSALPKLAEGRRVREHLVKLLDDPDPHLRTAVVHSLEALKDAKARPALEEQLEHELDGRVIRALKQALGSLGESGNAEVRKLRQQGEQLREELTELKTRLAKVEQRETRREETSADSKKGEKKPEKKTKATKKARAPKTSGKKGQTKKASAKKTPSRRAQEPGKTADRRRPTSTSRGGTGKSARSSKKPR